MARPVARLDRPPRRRGESPSPNSQTSLYVHFVKLLQSLRFFAILSRMDATLLSRRLRQDEEDLSLSLASSPSPSLSLPAARALADRLLLSSTPVAIRRLRQIALSGEEKAAVAACSKILDKSPATRDVPASSLSLSLPPESLSVLSSALAQIASASLASPAPEPSFAVLPSESSDA